MKSCFLLFAAFSFFSGCAGYNVVHFTNDQFDFGNFYSFRLENLKTKQADSTIQKPPIIIQLEEALIAEMRERDYKREEVGADLVLRYEIITNNRSELDMNPYPVRQAWFFPYGYYFDMNERNFTESILLLEIKLPETQKIIWQGSLDMRYSKRSKKSDNIVIDAVDKIFDTYRYKAGSAEPALPPERH